MGVLSDLKKRFMAKAAVEAVEVRRGKEAERRHVVREFVLHDIEPDAETIQKLWLPRPDDCPRCSKCGEATRQIRGMRGECQPVWVCSSMHETSRPRNLSPDESSFQQFELSVEHFRECLKRHADLLARIESVEWYQAQKKVSDRLGMALAKAKKACEDWAKSPDGERFNSFFSRSGRTHPLDVTNCYFVRKQLEPDGRKILQAFESHGLKDVDGLKSRAAEFEAWLMRDEILSAEPEVAA